MVGDALSTELAKAYVTIVPAYEKGIRKNITAEITGIGEKAGKEGGRAGGSAFGGAFRKVLGAAMGVISAQAVGDFVKGAVQAFADAEQFQGGIKKLFGDEMGAEVIKQAGDAWKTAGMSANDYMETVTSFSGSVIDSLGGDMAKAAELSGLAIADMADQASVYGTSMESLQQTYKSLARGNFTTLDNLFGARYAGTKSGMQQLLKDAEALSGIHYDISSYSDIIQAIHVISEDMGVAGNAASEAFDTIAGSMNMAKAAWMNWVAGLANPEADIGALTENLVTAASAALKNVAAVLPSIIGGALTTLPQALIEFAPILTDTIIQLVPALMEALPQFIDAALQLFTGLIQALDQVMPIIIENLPTMIEQIGQALLDNLPILIVSSVELFIGIVTGILGATPQIVSACLQLGVDIIAGILSGITDHIDEIWQKLLSGIQNAVDKVKKFLGIESPSKLFRWMFEMVMEGGVVGIESGEDKLQRTLVSAIGGTVAAGAYAANPYSLDNSSHAQNVYINGARLNDSQGIQDALITFLLELQRLGAMQGASA